MALTILAVAVVGVVAGLWWVAGLVLVPRASAERAERTERRGQRDTERRARRG